MGIGGLERESYDEIWRFGGNEILVRLSDELEKGGVDSLEIHRHIVAICKTDANTMLIISIV